MPIDQKTDQLLQKLRAAICDCLCCEEMEQTVNVLERSGYRLFISIDAVQDDSIDELLQAVAESPEPVSLPFSESDELFLKALHIEVDDRAVR